jgi:micrococcal nuclease
MQVKVDVLDIDKYKRLVCIVWLNGRNINQEMIREGHAWAYKKYLDKSPYASEFIKAEEVARKERAGLWNEPNPQPPWEFRKSIEK